MPAVAVCQKTASTTNRNQSIVSSTTAFGVNSTRNWYKRLKRYLRGGKILLFLSSSFMLLLFSATRRLLLSKHSLLAASSVTLVSTVTTSPTKTPLQSRMASFTDPILPSSSCKQTSLENNNSNKQRSVTTCEKKKLPNMPFNNNHVLDIVHPAGFGTYLIEREKVPESIRTAIGTGFRRIDCAPVYFNEDVVGDTLDKIFHEGIVQRDELFITSKLASPFHHNPEIAVRKTLLDLKLDYLDLFLIHWPVAFKPIPDLDLSTRGWQNEDIDDSANGSNIDVTISIHETWALMEQLVELGLVKYIGVSNFPVILLHELLSKATIVPFVNQCECHPYLQQTQLIEYCRKRGIHFQAYSPLGASVDNDNDTNNESVSLLRDPVLQQLADKYNVTTAAICLAWSVQRGNSVCVKSTNPEHIRDNFVATNNHHIDNDNHATLRLSDDDMQTIAKLDRNHRFFRPEEWWEELPVAVFH